MRKKDVVEMNQTSKIEKLYHTCKKAIKINGYRDEYVSALIKYACHEFYEDGSRSLALEITDYAKRVLDEEILTKTHGTFFDLDRYCMERKTNFALRDFYYQILLHEGRNRVVDSYLIYLERKRPYAEKFYLPKRKCFMKINLIQSMQDLVDDKLDLLSVSLPPGTGKASLMTSKVLTPYGFTEMKNIKVGSKVISGSGNVANVIGVFPQGKRDCYTVTFDDGSSTVVSDNHLWEVQTRDDRRSHKKRVVTTLDMTKNLKVEKGKRLNYSINYVPKIDFEEKSFKIAPYLLGCLIADGYCTDNNFGFSNVDEEVVSRVASLLPDGCDMRKKSDCDYAFRGGLDKNNNSILRKQIRSLGLYNKKSEDKFIPRDYLYASYEQRIDLLNGLMDCDGSVNKNNCEYCTVSEQLAEDVCELVHSLGGYCSVNKSKAGYRDKNNEYIQCKDRYRLCIQFSSEQPNPFYLTRKRENYNPKRNELKRFVTSIEYYGKEECQCIYIDDESHLYVTDDYIITHNTTIEKFFLTGIMAWYPDLGSLFFSHSGDITRMFFDGVKDIITNDAEYCWHEIFPSSFVYNTNAKLEQISINSYMAFPSLQTTSTGSNNAGKVRAQKFLLCDDLIGGIEQAMNKNELDKLWNIYSVDARQRKIPGAKEIHVATRWSVHDVIGRLQRLYDGNKRCRFIAVPDIDPETHKSNFNYDVNGFDEEFFLDQQKVMDEISYRCLYKNEPIEREGLLYHEEDLRRYINLPIREPDAVWSISDTKQKGTDFLVMPVLYQYGEDYYLEDTICTDSSNYGVQYGRMADMIVNHNVQNCEIESNAGGDRVAYEVDKKVKEQGGYCNITTKYTTTNKETRIIVNAPWVKNHILFKDKETYSKQSEYGVFMEWLLSYSEKGKNAHDDVPDCLSLFAVWQQGKLQGASVDVIKNPFRM